MILGYNTNGFATHRLPDAVAILSDIGFRSIALTIERSELDPPDRRGVAAALARLGPLFAGRDLHVTIETGARFILDPRRKHQPTLVSADPRQRHARVDFLKAAVDVAAGLHANCVSLWSGAADGDVGKDVLWARLAESLHEVLAHAEGNDVRLAFEPEPGMFIDTMGGFEELRARMDHPLLGLTLDVGHVHCLNDGDVADHVRRYRDLLWNVHIEDMRGGRHEHLMFGDGDMAFGAVFAALRSIDYTGPLHVELSRHSHDAVNAARRSFAFLVPFLTGSAEGA